MNQTISSHWSSLDRSYHRIAATAHVSSSRYPAGVIGIENKILDSLGLFALTKLHSDTTDCQTPANRTDGDSKRQEGSVVERKVSRTCATGTHECSLQQRAATTTTMQEISGWSRDREGRSRRSVGGEQGRRGGLVETERAPGIPGNGASIKKGFLARWEIRSRSQASSIGCLFLQFLSSFASRRRAESRRLNLDLISRAGWIFILLNIAWRHFLRDCPCLGRDRNFCADVIIKIFKIEGASIFLDIRNM